MTLSIIEDYLLTHSGVAGQYLLKSKRDENTPTFFKPYQSPADFALRTAYVISAPLFLSAVTLEIFALSVGAALKSISYDLVVHGIEKAWSNLTESLITLAASFVLAFISLASPIVNLVDLVGGAVTTITEQTQEQDIDSLLTFI